MPTELLTHYTLTQYVREAIHQEWPAFVQTHPHLAIAIDETFWNTAAVQSIADDPAFIEALARASTLGTVLDQGPMIVRDFVSRWLKRIG